MSTYGENECVGEDKFGTIGGDMINLKYTETFQNNYQHRDSVKSPNVRI